MPYSVLRRGAGTARGRVVRRGTAADRPVVAVKHLIAVLRYPRYLWFRPPRPPAGAPAARITYITTDRRRARRAA